MFKRRKARVSFENAINERLMGDVQKNALDFAAFLRANDMTLERLEDCDGWNVYIRGINSAFVQIFGDKNNFNVVLHISTYDGESPVDDDLKAFTWAHVLLCPGCGSETFCEESQNRRTIFGKEFESTCQSPLVFLDPDANDLMNVQKLMLILV